MANSPVQLVELTLDVFYCIDVIAHFRLFELASNRLEILPVGNRDSQVLAHRLDAQEPWLFRG